MEKVQGWAEQGGTSVVITGTPGSSPQKFQQSFTGATVTVYDTGTLTLSTIYSDDNLTPKANPFTASSTTGYWFFYVADQVYDIKFSGGSITSPFTLSAVLVNSGSYSAQLGINTRTPVQLLDIEQGNIRLGVVVEPGAPTVAVNAAAGNLNGSYNYRITFVTANGETPAGTLSATVTPSNQQVNLTNIPVSSASSVIARRIYRTYVGGGVAGGTGITFYLKLVTTINDNTTTTYTDNIPDGSLGAFQPWMNTTGGFIYINSTRVFEVAPFSTGVGDESLAVNTGYGNAAFGADTLKANTVGFYNTAIGQEAMQLNTTGYFSTAVGNGALRQNTTGFSNVAIGVSALNTNTTGKFNTAVGLDALQFSTTSDDNVAIGKRACFLNTTGASNTAVGTEALQDNQTGSNNTAIGQGALNNVTAGSNTAVGASCLVTATTGTENVACGGGALLNQTTASQNTALGKDAGRYQADGSTALVPGNSNIYIGYNAKGFSNSDTNAIVIGASRTGRGAGTTVLGDGLFLTVTDKLVALGVGALDSLTVGTGIDNTAVGYGSQTSTTTGTSNTSIGADSMNSLTTGSGNFAGGVSVLDAATNAAANVGIGNSALASTTSGSDNVAIGVTSLLSATTASQNTAIGRDAGRRQADGSTPLVPGGSNVYIGHNAMGFNNSDSNSIVIGAAAKGVGANSVVLGNDSITLTVLKGTLRCPNMPTSSAGLSAGEIWSDSGVLTIV